jgi:purine-binding chemotaxis protein CheW
VRGIRVTARVLPEVRPPRVSFHERLLGARTHVGGHGLTLPEGQSPSVVICRARERWCAVPVEHVLETMRSQPVQPLRGMPDFVLGVSTIRGVPTPVIDLAHLLFGPLPGSAPKSFLALRLATRRVVLAVDRIVGVRALPPRVLSEVPPLLQAAARDGVTALGSLDGELLVLLESGLSLPPEVWSALEGSGET